MVKKKIYHTVIRLCIYGIGIWTVSLGIVLCKKCGLGISPISCIPFVLETVVPLSFGTLTMLFHFANILIQAVLKRGLDMRLLLQVPIAVLFGWIIDFLQKVIIIDGNRWGARIVALIFSVFFTALGMVFMVNMNLVQNPPDGTVKIISARCGKEFGHVKIYYDLVCVGVTVALGLAFLGRITGIGIATVVSAIFVGKTVSWLKDGIRTLCRGGIAGVSAAAKKTVRFAQMWK